MRATVVHPCELGAGELEEWRRLQRAVPSFDNPFLSPDFAVAVSLVRPRARVAVLTDGAEVVGFLPFERGRLGHGVPIAAGLTDGQGLVHASGLDWDLRKLLRLCGLPVWEFDHLLEGQTLFDTSRMIRFPSPVINLSGGYEPYLRARRAASARLRDLPPRQRRLAREVGPVSFVFDEKDSEVLRTLLAWKSAQYRRTGRSDRFAQAWIVALVEQLAATRADTCTGRLSVLYAGSRPVAAHFGVASTRVLPTWFPAHDPQFACHSPGLLLHLGMAEAAAAQGIERMDLGRGPEDHKDWLKTSDASVGEGRITLRGRAAVLHWIRRAPVSHLRNTVISSPVLAHAADRTLRTLGRARTSTDRYSAAVMSCAPGLVAGQGALGAT
jgi:CelD/BcsL family acetyltransferase involved in cellulose biosynthesis